MKSFLKLLGAAVVGAVVGGLAVHCRELEAENDSLFDALSMSGDDDCDGACCACCEYGGTCYPNDDGADAVADDAMAEKSDDGTVSAAAEPVPEAAESVADSAAKA